MTMIFWKERLSMNVKLFAGAAALAMTVQTFTGITVFADSEPQITGAVLNGTTAAISFSGIEEAATLYAASYNGDGTLKSIKLALINAYDTETTIEGVEEGAKIFVWNTANKPLTGTAMVEAGAVDKEPTEEATEEPSEATTEEATEEAVTSEPTKEPSEGNEPTESEEPTGNGIIYLNETSINADGIAGASVDGTTLTISAGGEYTIEGTLTDGQIITNSADAIVLNLNGVNVTSTTADALKSSKGVVTIATAEGTENTFTSEAGSAIESSKDLTIKGSGILNAVSKAGNGIRCKADLEIGAGDINVTAYNNGIKGDNSVKFTRKATNITVTAETGDAVKSDAIDSTLGTIEADKGTVTINGGVLNLTATTGDCIQADSHITVAGGTTTINAGANGIKANEINIQEVDDLGVQTGNIINGAITISDGTLNITSVEEAVRAAGKLDITGGETNITVTGDAQDGVKVGKNTDVVDGSTTTTTVDLAGVINISGGTLNIIKATDDAIVSMGDVNITGGTVTGGKAAYDDVKGDFFKVYDNFNMSEGTLDIAAYCDGIQSGKALTVTVSGTTETESNYTQGDVNIIGGAINITTNGGSTKRSHTTVQALENSCKGIKANTLLNISGGDITINAADDAIHSNWEVNITGGTMNLASDDDGVHADYMLTLGTEGGADNDFSIDISYSYEGIEGSVINVLSGTTALYSTDDGTNAAGDYQEGASLQTVSAMDMAVMAGPGGNWGGPSGPGSNQPGGGNDDSSLYGMLYIKGGVLFCEVGGDGLDSNGDINMSGGVAIVNGPTSGGNGVFDKGDNNNSFTLSSGTLVGLGSTDMQDNPTKLSQGYYSATSSVTKGSPFKITTDNGYIVVTPKITLSNALIYVSSADMTSGKSYSKTTATGSETGAQYGKTENGTFYGVLVGTN